MKRILTGALLTAVAGSASAQSWHTSSFSGTANPSSPWSYGFKSGMTGAFVLFDRPFNAAPGVPAWTGSQFPSNTPMVSANLSATAQTIPGTSITVPAGAAWATPGAGGEFAVFRFTAPGSGSYIISGVFHQIDSASTGPSVLAVIVRGTPIMNITIPAGGGVVMDPGPARTLSAGETIDFEVGPGAGQPGVATMLNGNISASGPLVCYANCDGSTVPPVLNISDFVCFQSRFAAGDTYANCDGSTAPPVLNINDFVCFQGAFSAGCP